MERGAFLSSEFEPTLSGYVEARLHNDRRESLGGPLTAQSLAILKLQDELIGHRGLPQYLVMDPATRDVLGHHSLRTGGYEEPLLEFLKEELQKFQERGSATP